MPDLYHRALPAEAYHWLLIHCRAFLKQREDKESDLSKDGSGIFKDPLMDTVYGQVKPLILTRRAGYAAAK